jgi:hypothetical protein
MVNDFQYINAPHAYAGFRSSLPRRLCFPERVFMLTKLMYPGPFMLLLYLL